MVIEVVSTSKVTFSGAGIAALAASDKNVAMIKNRMKTQTIGYDKINQLRHAKFLKNMDGVRAHMKKHAAIIAPKFDVVLKAFSDELGGKGIAEWTNPNGGYFISLNVLSGCAKRTVELCKEAGVVLTPAVPPILTAKTPMIQTSVLHRPSRRLKSLSLPLICSAQAFSLRRQKSFLQNKLIERAVLWRLFLFYEAFIFRLVFPDISVLHNFDKALRNKSVLYVVAVDDIDPESFCLVIYRHVFIYCMSAGKTACPSPPLMRIACGYISSMCFISGAQVLQDINSGSIPFMAITSISLLAGLYIVDLSCLIRLYSQLYLTRERTLLNLPVVTAQR